MSTFFSIWKRIWQKNVDMVWKVCLIYLPVYIDQYANIEIALNYAKGEGADDDFLQAAA
jgi:hypothetical protein